MNIKQVNITADCTFAGSDSYFVEVDFELGTLDKLLSALSNEDEVKVDVGGVIFETAITYGDDENSIEAYFGGITSETAINSFAARRFADRDQLTLSIVKDFNDDEDAIDGMIDEAASTRLPDNHWILPAHIIRKLLAA